MVRWWLSCSAALVLALAATAPAGAHRVVTGGAAAPDRPRIEALRCDAAEAGRCPRGATLELEGEYLETGRAVVFFGGKGRRRDNRRTEPEDATLHTLGVSSACHLHFELWTAPGWYRGGAAVDPVPALRSWSTSR